MSSMLVVGSVAQDTIHNHLGTHPCVLRGRPSIADFGLMAPLFAHLSRDPHPSHLMKLRVGIYVFEPRVLDYVPYSQYLDFPDLVLKMIQNGERVLGYPFDGYWQDLGRQDDYEQAVQEFDQIRPQIFRE